MLLKFFDWFGRRCGIVESYTFTILNCITDCTRIRWNMKELLYTATKCFRCAARTAGVPKTGIQNVTAERYVSSRTSGASWRLLARRDTLRSATLKFYDRFFLFPSGAQKFLSAHTRCVPSQCRMLGMCSRSFSLLASSEKTGIQQNISALQAKKRLPRKKGTLDKEKSDKETFLAVAYSTAEEYNIPLIAVEVEKQGLYRRLQLPDDLDGALHVTANYQVEREPRHIYFFSEGSVVFWNVPFLEQKTILNFLKAFQIDSYDENLVHEEKEDLVYSYTEGETRFSNSQIFLRSDGDSNLESYAFSNAMALSVKLALWEASLESFGDSIEWVTEAMKDGKKVRMSRDQVFRKRGELFALRHVINLGSDLLDTPDFYWDRQNLEKLYQQTYNHLNISRRTKVMNERLSYCSELIDLLTNHMNDKHHVRLELMIIALIMVEVMFECAHFIGRFFSS